MMFLWRRNKLEVSLSNYASEWDRWICLAILNYYKKYLLSVIGGIGAARKDERKLTFTKFLRLLRHASIINEKSSNCISLLIVALKYI
jgi:hypothetical protein